MANSDFDKLNLNNIEEINTKYGKGRMGFDSDGRKIIVRPGSSNGRPTLEMRNPKNNRGIEIRYGKKSN